MLADTLTEALMGIELGEYVEEIRLGYDHGQQLGFPFLQIVYLGLHYIIGISLDLDLM